MTSSNNRLSESLYKVVLQTLQMRFESFPHRHVGLDWKEVLAKLELKEPKVWSLHEMERTGGEPDVVGYDAQAREFLFMDCSAETPAGRRNLCYDRAALESRKEHKPANSAMDMAEAMGIELLSEAQYRTLQKLGEFDLKTSSWIQTPELIRNQGGALYADRRYNTIFVYHNGAGSYFNVRGFRGVLRV